MNAKIRGTCVKSRGFASAGPGALRKSEAQPLLATPAPLTQPPTTPHPASCTVSECHLYKHFLVTTAEMLEPTDSCAEGSDPTTERSPCKLDRSSAPVLE
jgi:hypothetical protein